MNDLMCEKAAEKLDVGTLDVDPAEICRFMGVNPLRGPSPAVRRLVEQACREGPKLLRPAATRVWRAASYHETLLALEGGCTLDTGRPIRGWSRLERVAICLCTIGSPLEEEVSRLLRCGSLALPAALDAFGSAAMVVLTERVRQILDAEVQSNGLRLGLQGEAGTGRWDLRQQTVLCGLAASASLGVTISADSILNPRKSSCLVIPAGRYLRSIVSRSQCQGCMLTDCAYRAAPCHLPAAEGQRILRQDV